MYADSASFGVARCLQAQSASLGVIAGICQVLLALWKVLGSCSVLQVEAVLQNVLLRLADGERSPKGASAVAWGSCSRRVTTQAACCKLVLCAPPHSSQ